MHIALGLLGVLAAIGGVIFWIRMASNTARDVFNLSDDLRAAFRRSGFSMKAQRSPLDSVDDARIAATGILTAIAMMDGPLTQAQVLGVRNESAELFNTGGQEAEDLAAVGQWLAQTSTPDEAIRRLSSCLAGKLDIAEANAFLERAANVAAIEGGGIDEMQRHAIERLQRDLR